MGWMNWKWEWSKVCLLKLNSNIEEHGTCCFFTLKFKCFSSSLWHVMIIIVMMIVMMIMMVMMNHESWMTNDEWWTIVINDGTNWNDFWETAKLQRLVIFPGWILRQNRSRLVRGQHSCSTAWLCTYQHQCSGVPLKVTSWHCEFAPGESEWFQISW